MRRRKGEPSTSGFKYICRRARRVTFISFKLPSASLGDGLRLGDFVSSVLAFCPYVDAFLNRKVLTLEVSSVFVVVWWEVVMSSGGDTVGGRCIVWWSCRDGIGVGGARGMGGCLERVKGLITAPSLRVLVERCWFETQSWPSEKSINWYI